jgi:hypothetical protein
LTGSGLVGSPLRTGKGHVTRFTGMFINSPLLHQDMHMLHICG